LPVATIGHLIVMELLAPDDRRRPNDAQTYANSRPRQRPPIGNKRCKRRYSSTSGALAVNETSWNWSTNFAAMAPGDNRRDRTFDPDRVRRLGGIVVGFLSGNIPSGT